MKEQDLIKGEGIAQLLKNVAARNSPAVMTHISRGKWHMTKIAIGCSTENSVQIEITHKEKHTPINIRIDQPVGISFKHDYSKYIFESIVIGFEPSINSKSGGIIVLTAPDRIDRVQRRNYYRVMVPESLNVRALFWHRGYTDDTKEVPLDSYWQGRLVDVSAGGMQVCIDADQKPNFREGQLIGIQFTPAPYQQPLLLEAQVRHIAPTADGTILCLGMQIIGLEASPEGRETLKRLCDVVKTYYAINQKTGVSQPIDALENI